MGTGYTRQSAAGITDAAIVEAADFNAEFNLIESAFSGTTGHTHDGTSGEGPLIPLTTSVTGILPVANGGTNASTAAAAATSLGLGTGDSPQFTAINLGHTSDTTIARVSAGVISVEGSNVLLASGLGSITQAYDAELAAIAGLTSAADKLPYFTGSETAALTDLTSFARTLLDDADAATMRTTLGVSGSSAGLTDIAALTPTDSNIIVGNGANWVAESGATARTSLGVGTGDSPTFTDLTLTGDLTVGDDIFMPTGGFVSWNSGDISLGSNASNFLFFNGGRVFAYYNDSSLATFGVLNQADAASVPVATFEGDRATPANGDNAYIDYKLSDSAGNQDAFARRKWVAVDITSGSEDGALIDNVRIAGTNTDKTRLEGSVFSPASSDGTALGSGTYMWSDLFLASGGVINFNNGDITITNGSSNYLTFAGGQYGFYGFQAAATPAIEVFNQIDDANVSVASFNGDRATPANNDYAWIDFKLSDSAGNQDVFARIGWKAIDVTSTSEDGQMYFGVTAAGTYTDKMYLSNSELSPITNDGMALGGASNSFSDLFLASGAFINFNNGDVNLEHSTNALNMSGGYLNIQHGGSAGTATLYVGNTTDNASVLVAAFEGNRATPANGDIAYVDYRLSDAGGTQTVFVRDLVTADDVTDASEDGSRTTQVMKAGTLTSVVKTDASGHTYLNGASANAYQLLGTMTTTSGTSQELTGLTLTNFKFLRFVFNGVSHNSGADRNYTLNTTKFTNDFNAGSALVGFVDVDLTTGIATGNLGNAGSTGLLWLADTTVDTTTTTLTVAVSSGSFDAGSIKVYGI